MKKLFIKIILFSSIITIFSTISFAYDIDIKADVLEYRQESDLLLAKGNVSILWQNKFLQADEVEFELQNKFINARGNVSIEEDGNIIFADSISYYYDEEKGELIKTRAASNMAFIQSEKMQRLDKYNFAASKTIMSNCDLDDPHTSFKASRAVLRQGKRITLYNAVFYIAHVPVFYFPVLTRSLERGKEPFTVSVEPGYSQEAGVSLKTTVGFSITENLSDELFLDYLGKSGTGYGTQLDYAGEITKFSVYGYNINDEIVGIQRWAIRPSFWSRVADIWTIQSQAEFLSDPDFNNIFSRNNWNRVSNNPHSFAAFTRSGTSSNIMFVFEKYDYYNEQTKAFEPYQLAVPRISYTLYPRKLFWDISNNFNVLYNYAGEKYISDGELFYKNTVVFEDAISKNFRALNNLTFTPYLGIGGNFYDKDDLGNMDESMFLTYSGGLNTRLRPSNWMDWNFDYSIAAITDRNSFEIDRSSGNYGITKEKIAYSNYMYITDNLTVRNVVSYDLRKFRDSSEQITRWSPIENELVYLPKSYLSIYIRQTQTLDPSVKFEGLQSEITIGRTEIAYIKLGIFYEEIKRDVIDNVLGFGLWLTPKWRLDYNMRSISNFKTQAININEYEIKLYRDLHCYNFGATVRVRKDLYQGYIHDFYFMFNLKTNMSFNRQKREEAELFYPWK
ncbi:MAG: hypothetical protein LBQ37_01185 [Elusimicrobiota bacterium]|jgi:LPS-assembly protein|nr:hypothetical protein [Elusimicrobiota bacterium]